VARPEVVVAGHVCLDVIPRLDGPASLEPGALVEVGRAELSTGGAVANTGLALHRLGVGVRLVGRVGDDLFGGAVLGALRAVHPDLASGMVVAAGEATSYSVVVSPPDVDRSFLHCPGANDGFTSDDVSDAALAGARVLHFGYPPLMRSMFADGGAELRRLLERAAGAGAVTSLDLAMPDPRSEAGRVDWPALLAATLPHVDVVAPSIGELLRVLGDDPSAAVELALLRRLAERLLGMGATVVAIKLGDQGLYLRTARDVGLLGLDRGAWADREVLSPCFAPARVAGTTGSGDATIAGLLAALLRGEDPVAAATSATAVGACSVEAPDATGGIPRWPQVAERMRAGWPRLPARLGPGALAPPQADALGTFVLDRRAGVRGGRVSPQ
jgi:sugar/nucleoside kinase (ribokinase family)